MKSIKRLDRKAILEAVSIFMEGGTNSEEEDADYLITICANCPDPVAAMELLVGEKEEANEEETPANFVEKAFSMPARSVDTYLTTELHRNHPLRRIRFE